ncbi:hypothetical protein HBI56_080280 [Parastagonospora nodorum]|uniref:Uncharacterized protein n=1 Tax=Phaeosphaeria nodorum (strain SN15 / ATCC MYA-4574 / FGSC 10173) TaxID=321614 RepID=A0A7U2I8J2_PHANO|nr:hypothetical protein HBH56_106450 [Parastagonospora nodorum]QRD04833.1 hypothetical protein JI435_421800 [Parastagonospora nodorum SN15]KAH3929574.1 hypothetical protein HBH54_123980 [Parastagonospora nodorum]KAH3951396.1 hypothetical protein HBH53_057980 [Parastagonospora nodorum]KAH4049484.1 hypothetical protein HBH49_147310 [Parastagonospora nodorum]
MSVHSISWLSEAPYRGRPKHHLVTQTNVWMPTSINKRRDVCRKSYRSRTGCPVNNALATAEVDVAVYRGSILRQSMRSSMQKVPSGKNPSSYFLSGHGIPESFLTTLSPVPMSLASVRDKATETSFRVEQHHIWSTQRCRDTRSYSNHTSHHTAIERRL